MNTYYAPVLREQFNQLYRHGYTIIPDSILIKGQSPETPSHKDCENIVDCLLSLSPYEYEEEYVILQFDFLPNLDTKLHKMGTRDLSKVYALNARSKEFFESRLDPRIKLQEPIFQRYLEERALDRVINEGERTLEEFWRIFNIHGNIDQLWTSLDKKVIIAGVKARIEGRKTHNLSDEDYWTHVLAYDRYEPFPSDTLGYFYDSGQICAHYTQPGLQIYGFQRLYTFLEQLNSRNPKINFKDLKINIEKDSVLDKFKDTTTFGNNPTSDVIRGYLVTPIFLQLKDQLREIPEVKDSFIFTQSQYIRKQLNETEFKTLLALLSFFFGFRKFYDFLYENPKLPIYSITRPEVSGNTNYLNQNIAFSDTKAELEPSKGLQDTNSGDNSIPMDNESSHIEHDEMEDGIKSIEPNTDSTPSLNEQKIKMSKSDTSKKSHRKHSAPEDKKNIIDAQGQFSLLEFTKDSELSKKVKRKSSPKNKKTEMEIFSIIRSELSKSNNHDGVLFSEIKKNTGISNSDELKEMILKNSEFDIIKNRSVKIIFKPVDS